MSSLQLCLRINFSGLLVLGGVLAMPQGSQAQADSRTFNPVSAEGRYAAHPGLIRTHRNRLTLGVDMQLELSPVRLLTPTETRPVLRRRDSMYLSAVYSGWQAVTVWASWSVHHQVMAPKQPQQWHVGDIRLGSTWPLYANQLVAVAADAWADIPIGGTWNSDRMPKVGLGGTAEFSYRWLGLLGSVAFVIRRPSAPAEAQAIVTSQFQLLAATSFGPPHLRGFLEFAEARDLKAQGAPRELRTGVNVQASDIVFRLGFGLGLSDGFGTPSARFFAGAAWRALGPTARVHDAKTIIASLSVEEEEEEEEEEEDDVLTFETESKKVAPRKLCPALKPSIYFSEGSAVLSRSSQLSLRMLSNYIVETPEIYHLLIEGRASREGSSAENWRLSRRRAEAVMQELVARGVPHLRLSIRALGETSARDEPHEERRADLCVVRRLDGLDDIPDWTALPAVPWFDEDVLQ